MGVRLELCQAFLGDRQRAQISPAARPYDVAGNTAPDTREYGLFKRRFAEPRAGLDAWGVVSWRFALKCAIDPAAFLAFAEAEFANGADCVFINPFPGLEGLFLNVWEQWLTEGAGPRMALIAHVHTRFGGNMRDPMTRATTAYCNYFIANERFWTRYFAFVDAIVADCEAEARRGSEAGRFYQAPGNYHRDPRVTNKVFLVERLFSFFLQRTPELRCVAMPAEESRYIDKFGLALGRRLRHLSALKLRGSGGEQTAMQQWNSERHLVANAFGPAIWLLEDPNELLLPVPAAADASD